jgi:hypothetical protein
VLRASDQDREQVALRLRNAALEGRLDSDELDERLGHALAARTYGELDRLLTDLPAHAAPPARRPRRGASLTLRAVTLLTVALMLAALAAAYAPAFASPRVAQAAGGPHNGAFLLVRESFSLLAPAVGLLGLVLLCAGLAWLFSDHATLTDK